MGEEADNPVTVMLRAAAGGDKAAADRLLPLVYDQLRAGAQKQLAGEAGAASLQATVLVHEAYLRLVGPRKIPWANRAHFYAAAAEAIRRLLLDHARTRARRGGPMGPLGELADVGALAAAGPERILAVEAAMRRLEGEDPEAAAVVRLRFYAGLSVEQTAEALGVSERTAARLWTYARALLFRALQDDAPGGA